MLRCGITGYKGNLGKTFLKINKNFHYIKFKGDISKKKDINFWLKNNHFDLPYKCKYCKFTTILRMFRLHQPIHMCVVCTKS